MWQDKVEILPDGRMMLVMDIRAMKDGEPFKVFPGLEEKAIEYAAMDEAEALYFIEFYCRSKRWGLPSGGGWANETEFCMRLLMNLDELTDKIDAWRMEQSRKQ